jgi:hypothetical protein
MTAASPETGRRELPGDPDVATVLSTVAREVRDARAVLAGGDPARAASEASSRLQHAEDLIHRLSASPRHDRDTWILAVALRDELSGYLLAASTLGETGVAPTVVLDVLQRGADQAEEVLARLAAAAGRTPGL